MATRSRLLLPAALLLLSSAAFAEPARLERARQALRERSFAKAQELASEELRANPQADEALYLRALAQFHQQRLSEARADVARLLKAKPASPWRHKARFLDAECLSRARDFKAAVAVLSDEARRLLSAPRKRELCGVIVRFADALARERDPKDPKDLDGPPADYRKACALYDKALGLEIDEQTREEVLFKRARAREHVQAYQAAREYMAYLERFDPTWGDAPGRERRPTGAHRWEARERLLHATLSTNRSQAWRLADDLLRLLETPAGKSAPEALGATVAWLRLRAIGMPTPPRHALPAGLQASEAFLASHPRHPAAVAVAWWRAEAQRTHGQLDDAVSAYEGFLAGKGFQLPAGAAAEADLDALRASPKELLERWTREAVFLIGEIRFSQRRFEAATERYEEYVRRFPNGPRWSAAHAKIREAQFQRCLEAVTAKDYPTARKRFDAFLAAHPLDGRAPRVLFLLGQLSVVEGEELVEQALKDPAKLALATPRFEQAIADWARLVSKYPRTNEAALALYRTGLLQEERLGQLETALETYRRVTWGSASGQARARIALLTRQQLKVTTERVFRSDEAAKIKLETRNLETLSVRQYFLSLEGYFRKHKQAGGVERLDIALIQPDKTWETKIAGYRKYAPHEQQLEVPFPKGQAGVCLVHVSGGDFETTTLVVKSDLELIFRVSREELLAFAQDARQGKAAPGVEVLASDGEKVFSLGKTGQDGVLRKKHERLAQANDWRFFASLGNHSAASELSLSGLRNAVQLRPRAYLYTDRPAYQPGQTVHVKAVLRGVEQSSYALPKAKNYRVRLIDARGRAIDEELVAVTKFGTVCATFTLDASVPVGTYRVVAGPEKNDEGPSASGTLQVQQFELRPLELALEAPRKVYQRGEVVELTAKARFSWGQPAANKQIVIDLPNGRREEGKTDERGSFTLKFDTTSQPPGGVVRFQARLPEEGVAANLEVFLPRLGFQASVSTSQELVLAGEPVELRFVTKGPDGEPVGRKLNVFVQRREARKPDPVLNAVPWFRAPSAGTATRTVQEHQVTTDPKTGEARLSVKVAEGGDYVIRAVGEDRFGQAVVGESGLRVSDDEDGTRLRVFSESASLEVGQAHSVRLHSRLKKATLALLTWEGDAVLAHRVVTLEPGFTSLETKVDHLHFPNFRLAVTALEEQKLHAAHKDFQVARELRVTLKPKQERYAPGETAEVELVVTDQLGRPVEAELSLALVEETLYARFPELVGSIKAAFEEGVKRRAEFRVSASNAFRYQGKTREILKAFKDEANRLEEAKSEELQLKELANRLDSERSFARGRAGGRFRDARRESLAKKMAPRQSARPMPSPADAPAMEPSGDMAFDADDEAEEGGAESAPRQDEIGGGFWKCEVVTDAQGRATVSVPLPQRTTRWRLTTRGVSVATLVGEARSHVVTAKDFFVELLAPRHLREGDEVRLLGRVHGPKGADVELELQLREGERFLASRRARAKLDASGTAEVVFANMKVPAAEALELVLSGKSGQSSDSLSRQVQVVPWGEEVVVHGGGTATGDASVVLRLPDGQLQSRWLSVMVGPSLEGTLAELALQRGNCWPESLGARLLGLASALHYARKHGADETTLQRLERALRRSLGAVAPTQQGNRGWGVGGGSVEETCFVLWGLAQAKGAIHFVPATQAAENLLLNAYRRTSDANLRTRILHALAEAGRADFRLANSLYRLRNRLEPAALARLALVFLKLDRRNFATELARALPRKVTGNSEIDAWQLLALARVTPGSPVAAELASKLLAGRGAGRHVIATRHGLAVAALAAYYAESQPERDDARITVLLDGTPLQVVQRRGASGAVRFDVPSEQLGDKRELVLRFRLEGRARYAYAATFRGFRPSYAAKSKRGWRVYQRRYLHAPLRHRGKSIGVQSTSPVKNATLGQRVEVQVSVSARARKESALIVHEPLPAGMALVPGTLQGGFVHHELQDGELRLYFPPHRYVSTIRYALVGRTPGTFRVPPTRLVDEQDRSRVGRGEAATLSVLGPGEQSPDRYQLNDSERYALGKLHFAEGELGKALEYLAPLFERKNRPNERDLAKMILWIHTAPEHYDARRIVAAFEVLAVRYPDLEVPFDKILVVGRAYRDLGEHERAMLVFRATIDASFLSDSQIGAILADQGQPLGAVDYQEALWWHYPGSAEVAGSLFATAQRVYELAPQWRALAKEQRLSLSWMPASEEKPTRVALIARAIRMLRFFLAHHPQSPLADDAAFSMANAYLDLKRHADVVVLSQRSLSVYPKSDFQGSFRYMTALGHFWRRDYGKALEHGKVVAESKTRFHRLGKYILGQIHHAQNDPAQAIKWYGEVKQHFADAKEAIEYFERKHLRLPEVTVVRPGKPVEVELASRNLAKAELEVYKVDLMKLYLREKDLSKITQVELAGIAPQQKLNVQLGSATDYADKTTQAQLKLAAEGAYLVIARADDHFASGLVLITPLQLEVQEDSTSGRVRANVRDVVKGRYPAGVHVKAVGSGQGNFKSGETDLRGVFVADGLRGKATVIAREGDARYAFYRGQDWLGAPERSRPRPIRQQQAPAVDYEGYLRKQNRAVQQKARGAWDQKRRNKRRGVQVQEAR